MGTPRERYDGDAHMQRIARRCRSVVWRSVQGDVDALVRAHVLGLRRLDIQDARWQMAMRAIGEAVQVVSSKASIRIYERVGDSDEFVPISLDVAGA